MTTPLAPAADPLAELRGIHLPDPIGLWPPAPGWWVVAGLLLLLAIAAVVLERRRRRSLARKALLELDHLVGGPQAGDLQGLATTLSELLRRVALVRFGRRVARLHGDAWQAFLLEHAPRARRSRSRRARAAAAFAGAAGHALALAPYVPPSALDASLRGTGLDRDGLIGAARSWIRWNT